MAAFEVLTPTPILILGDAKQVEGEIWLANSGAAEIKVDSATLTVNFPSGTQSGPIFAGSETAVPAGSIRRLLIRSGSSSFTPPGSFTASVDLSTSAGSQTIPATVIVTSSVDLELSTTPVLFTGVVASTTYAGEVVAVNRGNASVAVGPIPDETLLEMVSIPRILAVAPGGAVSLGPAEGLTPGGTATFTNNTPTIDPGGFAKVDFVLTTPSTLAANRHFRVLPRIVNQRFVIDLLT